MSRSNSLASLIILASLLGITRRQGEGCDIDAVELSMTIFGDRFEATTP